ncbi:CAP domain-containing protein [Streptosporangium sp. KLBMP 9127]|nr:CAP domain-containing protein [Streptosporangium sp. KLBMP 9127]
MAVLITGIVIGRESRGPDVPDQVYLNNAAPRVLSPEPTREPKEDHAKKGTQSRAPLGVVIRPTPVRTLTAKRTKPPTSVTKQPPRNSIPGSLETTQSQTVVGPDLGEKADEGQFSTMEDEVVRLTNNARRKQRCRPLRIDSRLAQSARLHSAEMAESNHFAHNSPDGTSPWTRMERAGYPNGGAENIGRGYQSAEEAVRGWMGSPSHRANILNCSLTAIGVGVADGAGGPWWTQDFGYS